MGAAHASSQPRERPAAPDRPPSATADYAERSEGKPGGSFRYRRRMTDRPGIRAAAAAATLAFCLAAPTPAAADGGEFLPVAEVSPALLDRLDAPSWEAREAASAELLTGADELPGAIRRALPAAADRPEVRARLIEALHHHFLRGLRRNAAIGDKGAPVGLLEKAGRVALRGPEPGSLGVSHRAFPAGSVPGVDAASIAVVRTLPGFPAFGRLREGDLIVGLNGRPVAWPEPEFPDADDRRRRRAVAPRGRLAQEASAAAASFSTAVQNAGAGAAVLLRVIRGGQTLEVPVTLARLEDLQRLYPGGRSGGADAAWREHLAGLGLVPDAAGG